MGQQKSEWNIIAKYNIEIVIFIANRDVVILFFFVVQYPAKYTKKKGSFDSHLCFVEPRAKRGERERETEQGGSNES